MDVQDYCWYRNHKYCRIDGGISGERMRSSVGVDLCWMSCVREWCAIDLREMM
jgi:hypothetical protein